MKNKLLYTTYFGWFQAVSWSYRIDVWSRYSSIARQIKSIQFEKPVNILDVGGGQGSIKYFLDPDEYNINVLDLNKDAIEGVQDSRITALQGDGCSMPFNDNSFDIVVSVDSLEHVPATKKRAYCLEMKRVAQSYVILHCPADSLDGHFQGTTCDAKFQQWYHNRFKRDDSNTAEHLKSELPRIEELCILFPGAIIVGRQNTTVWLSYMKKEYTPYAKFISGLIYKLKLQKQDDIPPYHACLLIWSKG
jgi:hypothetical protein